MRPRLHDCQIATLLAFLIALGVQRPIVVRADEKPSVRQAVSLIVDFGDGVEKRFTAVPWKKGITILNVMKAAQAHPRGIKFKFRGSGATALLISIDDLKNQGGNGKNWIYQVNGKTGDRSFGVRELEPADTVLWKFGTYR